MNVLNINYRAKDAAQLFAQSLRETGFAVINNHPIDAELIQAVYAEWMDFFMAEYKHDYIYNRETHDGYYPISIAEKAKGYDVKDIKEFFHVYPWGQYPKELSNKTLLLYNQLLQLAETLLQWVEHALPKTIAQQLSMPLQQMIIDSPRTPLRVLHYPPLSGSEPAGAERAAAHEDINLLTLLVAATQSGLQVKDSAGNWHDVPSDLNSIVVNAGDMLSMCTQNYFKSTTHRVINPVNSTKNVSRLSMPLFLHPRQEVRLSATHTAESYLNERLRELGVL